MRLSSIRVRLMINHLIVIILAMGLSGFLLLSFLERYFLQATEESLMVQAMITAQTLIPGVTTEGPPIEVSASPYNTLQQQQQLQNFSVQSQNVVLPEGELPLSDLDLSYLNEASLQLGIQLNTRIRILNVRGLVAVDSWQTDNDMDLSAEPLVEQVLQGDYASYIEQTPEGATMHVAMAAYSDEQLVGIVYLSQPLSDMRAVLHDLRLRWVLSTLVAVLISGLAALLLSRTITEPLSRLTRAASALAEGQFDQQVPVRSRDELGQLSRAFNEMTARLRAARQVQIDFVANVSHELRTPLTAVKGTVETLRDGAVDDSEVRDRFLETVENETDRLIRLVNDLLILSKADSEAISLQRRPLDLVILIQRVVERIRPHAEERALTLIVELSGDSILVRGDPDRIEQILVNLLDNALEYSKPGGQVVISAAPDADQLVRVQVRDKGIGIPAVDLPHIGQRFYRADKARSRAVGGSGLGLAIAQALVRAHGGQLWLESQEGVGTVVSFTLPIP